ncbi:MAG: hypothetical protein K2X36_04900, partial [Microbacteriaceae bacterium]|nr:hypothetical protein [Microbacteriaceae bacterium]
PETAPPDWLDYLARWLDLPWDDALPETAKRCLVRHAGEILRERGTRAGLSLLLRCVVGDGGVVIRDPAVDHPPIRLGGGECGGSTLPAVLAGMSSRLPVLGSGALLGHARLGCNADRDPLRGLVARLFLTLTVPRTTRRTLEPLMAGLLAHYVPAGLPVVIAWHDQRSRPPGSDAAVLVVDVDGPGILDEDTVLGRTALGGRDRGRVGSDGIRLGFRLQ